MRAVSTARYKFSLQIWFSLISFFEGLLRLKQFLEASPTTELLHAELLDASSTGTKHKHCRITLLIQKVGIMKLQNVISLVTEVHHPDCRCKSYFSTVCFYIILPCVSCIPSGLFFKKKMSGSSFCHSFISMKV